MMEHSLHRPQVHVTILPRALSVQLSLQNLSSATHADQCRLVGATPSSDKDLLR
jgi:hypothetical protein